MPNGNRTARIWTSIALLAQRDGSSMSPAHACSACVEAIGVSGAGLMVTGRMNSLEPVYVTESRIGDVEELQATLGEGPGTDALESGRPMLVGDLAAPMSNVRWPTFASEVDRLGVRAMYSLPLALGAIGVGVLDLYNDIPSHLNQEQLVEALIYADTALLLLIDAQSGIITPEDAEHSNGHGPVLWHAEVHQAAGMLSEQLGDSPVEALVRLRSYAHAHGKRLTDVARAVVQRRLRFQPKSATPSGG